MIIKMMMMMMVITTKNTKLGRDIETAFSYFLVCTLNEERGET